MVQPTLSLWDEPPVPFRERIVADAIDRVAWMRARSRGVTATDAAQLSGPNSVRAVALEKVLGSRFSGNAYTQHGTTREPHIARWANSVYGMQASSKLFHADGNKLHMATPDGWRERGSNLELCEIKTTTSEWRGIPRAYLRQVWWQQYVLGAERTLVVWERHDNFVPVRADPECRWVDRDDNEIHRLVVLAEQVLVAMRR
ncbi:hypothetical protein BH11ACT3_BH11ACT3_06260 [soil metagenome]